MKKIGLFYGSNSGNTEYVAEEIAKSLGINKEDIHDISSNPLSKILDYDYLLLGSCSWGVGDVHDDWDLSELEGLALNGKSVALFGVGDSSSYSDSFCGAIGQLADAVQKAGATLIGNKVDASDYSFDSSESVKDGFFCGLAIDEDNESDKTAARIENWVEQLKQLHFS